MAKEAHITGLLVMNEHVKQGHAGVMQTLACLRRRFWPIGGAATVRKHVNRCYTCKRMRGNMGMQKVADPPEHRASTEPLFTHVGADCFGLMTVRVGQRREKRWGALFTCLASRAVHIKVLHSMSTDSMMGAIRRLVARKGAVVSLVSDKGTNFVGAKGELGKELENMDVRVVRDELMKRRMTCYFNPPAALHFGGI